MSSIFLVAEAPWVRNDVLSATDDTRYEITVVPDPHKRLEEIADAEPGSVVVVDMQVGSMGGMAICRAIREVRASRSAAPLPVILLLDRQADAFLARRAGAAGWVQKPFTAYQLRSAVDEVSTSISLQVGSAPES
jgi:DNA-binding response OmpR family regulator